MSVARIARLGAVAVLLGAVAVLSGSLAATQKIAPLAAPQSLRTSGEPFAVAIDGSSGRAYVTDTTENTLVVFDLASGEALAHIPTGRHPGSVVLLGGRAFVSNFAEGSITVVDTQTNKPLRTLAVGGLGLAADRDSGRLYAAAGSALVVLDTRGDTRVATIAAPAGASLWGVALDAATGRLFVTDSANPRVLVYDGATHALVSEVALDAPARFGITAGGGRVLVASYTATNAQLSLIDAASAKVVSRVPIDGFTDALALDAAGLVYAASAKERSVAAVDPTSARLVAKTTLERPAGGLAVSPASGGPVIATAGGPPPPARALVDAVPVVRP